MKTKPIILILFVILGTLLPWFHFYRWIASHGWNVFLFWEHAVSNSASAGLVSDLVLTAILFICLILWDRNRLGWKWIAVIFVSVSLVGVCLGFPLYLWAIHQKPELG